MRRLRETKDTRGHGAGWGITAAAVLCLPVGCPPPAQAAPNGLTQIPIAKVFGNGVAAFSVARVAQQTRTKTETAQYGIGNVCEVGLDYQSAPSDQRTLLGNVKYLFAHRPSHLPDMACGLANVATVQKAVPYVVATTQPRAADFSLGTTRPDTGGAYYGLAGVSYNVSPTIQLVADEIGGRSSYGTLGVIASLSKTFALNVAYAQPNAAHSDGGTNPHGYVVNLAYTFHLKGGRGQDKTQNRNPTAGTAG